jgi:hypothetical protein
MSEQDPYGMVLRQLSDGLCISGLVKAAQWSSDRRLLRDTFDGTPLGANTFPDAIEESSHKGAVEVYLLNFWQPTGVDRLNVSNKKSKSAIANLTPLGFILTASEESCDLQGGPRPESGEQPIRRFRRVGLYIGNTLSSWFSNSDWKAIIVD